MSDNLSRSNSRPTLSPRQLKVIKSIFIGSAIVSLPITFYWRWHFSGLYKILASLDIKITGSFSPASTTFFTFFLLGLGIALPILILYRLVYGGDKVVSPEAERQAIPVKDVVESTQNITHLVTQTHRYSIAAVVAGLILVGFGIYNFWQGSAAGALTPVTTQVLLDGTLPSSRYIHISGTAVPEEGIMIEETNNADTYYVPLYDEKNQQKPALILKSKNAVPEVADFTGVLSRPIGGFARDQLVENAVVVDDTTWVLDVDNSPGSLKVIGVLLMVGGILLSGGGYIVLRRKMKRLKTVNRDA